MNFPLVVLTWENIIHDAGWAEDIPRCPVFSSVGWLISGDENPVRIANTIAEDGTPAGILAVPIGAAIRVISAGSYEHPKHTENNI